MSAAGHSGLFRNTLLYLPAQFLGPVLQFATTIVWTHQLDPVSYGVVTFIVAAQELTGFVGLTWWTLYVLRFSSRHEGEVAQADLRAMDNRMALCGALMQCLATAPVLLSFDQLGDPALFAASAAYLALRALLMHYGEWARAQHRIGLYTAAQLVGPAGGAAFSMILIATTGGGAVAGLAGLALGQALGLVWLAARLPIALSLGRFDRRMGAAAFRFGWPLGVAAFSAWIAANGVRLMVQWTEGDAAVGLLSVGWGLGQRMASVLAMLCAAAAFPLAVKQLEGGDRKGAIGKIGLNGALMIGIVAPAAVGLAILSRPFTDLLIAAPYREATALILPIAFIATGLKTIKIHTIDQTALLLERSSITMRLNVIEAATTVIGCSIGLATGGMIGGARGTLAGVAAGLVISLFYAHFQLGLRFPVALIGRIAAACGVMAATLLALPAPIHVASLGLTVALGGLVYCAALVAAIPPLRGALRERFVRP